MWHPFRKIRNLQAENAAIRNELSRLQQEKAVLLLQIVHYKAMKDNAIAAKKRLISENYKLVGKILMNDAQKN